MTILRPFSHIYFEIYYTWNICIGTHYHKELNPHVSIDLKYIRIVLGKEEMSRIKRGLNNSWLFVVS